MRIDDLFWDAVNVEHIALHGVSPEEVEEVCSGLNISEKQSYNRYILSGQSVEGKYLNVVVERINKGLFRPITAYPMNESQKSRFRRNVGK